MRTFTVGRRLLCLVIVCLVPLLSYPLSWLPSASTGFRFSLMLPVAVVALVALLLAAARAALAGDAITCPRALLWPCGLLAVSWLLSVRFSQQPFYSVAALIGCGSNVAILLLAAHLPERHLGELCWAWLGTATVVALNGLVRLGDPEFLSTIGNRNFVGAYLVASILIAVGLRDKRAIAAGALLIAALVFTRSRGAWLALGMVGSSWVVFSGMRERKWKCLLIVVIAAVLAWLTRGEWRGDVRPQIWRGTVAMCRARWLLGHGLGTFAINYPRFRPPGYFLLPKAANLTDHAHNELLETLAEQGVIGLVATIWLWAAALRLGACHRRAGLLAATGVFLLHGMIDVDLRHPPNQTLLWLLLGLLASGGETCKLQLRLAPMRFVVATACVVAAIFIGWGFVVQPVRADIWERRARIAETQGDLTQAASAAELALEIQPLRVGTRYLFAGILAKTPTVEARARAIEEAERVEELAPDYGDITFNLGQLLVAEHRSGEAVEYLQRAVTLNPYNADKRVVLAFALGESGQLMGAREQLQEALRLDPRHEKARALLNEYQQRTRP